MGSLGGPAAAVSAPHTQLVNGGGSSKPAPGQQGHGHQNMSGGAEFRMPLHYPRYTKADYEAMPEWRLDCLLREYGLPDVAGGLDDKRRFAMGTFLWPGQY